MMPFQMTPRSMTLTLTLKLKIAFWTLLPPGAYCSVSQTHLDILYFVEMTKLIMYHSKEDKFHATPAFLKALAALHHSNVIFLTGFKGCGKTRTAMKLLEEVQFGGARRAIIFDNVHHLMSNIFECPPAVCFVDDIDAVGEHGDKYLLSSLLSLKMGCDNQTKFIFSCDGRFLQRNKDQLRIMFADRAKSIINLSIDNKNLDASISRKIISGIIERKSLNMADDLKNEIAQNLAKQHLPSFSLCTESFLQLDDRTTNKPIAFDHYNLYKHCFAYIRKNEPEAFAKMQNIIAKKDRKRNIRGLEHLIDVFLHQSHGINFISTKLKMAFAQYFAFHDPEEFLVVCARSFLKNLCLDIFDGQSALLSRPQPFAVAKHVMIESRYLDIMIDRLYDDVFEFKTGSFFQCFPLRQMTVLHRFFQKVCANPDEPATSQCFLHIVSMNTCRYTIRTNVYMLFKMQFKESSFIRYFQRAIEYFSISEVEKARKLMDVYASEFGKRSFFYMRQRFVLNNPNRSILPLVILLPKRSLQTVHGLALFLLFIDIFMITPIHDLDIRGFVYYNLAWSCLCGLFYVLYLVYMVIRAIQKKYGKNNNSCLYSCSKLFDKCLFRIIFFFCQIQFYVIALVMFIFMCRGLKNEISWIIAVMCILKVTLASVYRYSKPKKERDYALHTLQILINFGSVIIELLDSKSRIILGIYAGSFVGLMAISVVIRCIESKLKVEIMSVPI